MLRKVREGSGKFRKGSGKIWKILGKLFSKFLEFSGKVAGKLRRV